MLPPCQWVGSIVEIKEDDLYHAGRYSELIEYLEGPQGSFHSSSQKKRILSESKSRIRTNQLMTLEYVKYRFSYQYYVHALIEAGNFEKALQICNEGIEETSIFAKLFKQHNHRFESDIELNNEVAIKLALYRGYINWFMTGNAKKSLQYIEGVDISSLTDKYNLHYLLSSGFFYDKIMGDYDKAFDRFKQIINLSEKLSVVDIDSKYAYSLQSLRRLMHINMKLGRLEEAKEQLDKYESIADNSLFKLGKFSMQNTEYFRGYLSMMDSTAGALFALLRDFDKSKEYFNRAFEVVNNIDQNSTHMWDQKAIGTYYVLYGTYYLGLQKKYDEALQYVDKGITYLKPYYIEAIETEIDIESAYIYSGELHYLLKNYPNALAQADNAIKFAGRYHNKNVIASGHRLKGQVYYALNDIQNSKLEYEKALQLTKAIENTDNWQLYYGMVLSFDLN